ncbi:MAG: HAMP domain-containing histidine kinase [Bdellovibrionaceae bacterium]|nr:HAMP domain-containing histidine kinase [Pseudobdellovibrionaceae bacterium]
MKWKTVFILVWVLFTTSMIGWWWFYGLDQLATPLGPDEYQRHRRMLFWEGSFFLLAQVTGGFLMYYFMKREDVKNKSIRNFFAGFSHELKTSISRLRLQGDVLAEDERFKNNKQIARLVKNINQLDLQLENSLWMSQLESIQTIKENFLISKIITGIKNEFQEMTIELNKDVSIETDFRALHFVFRNLVQNALIHGGSSRIKIQIQSAGSQTLITVVDDGVGAVEKLKIDDVIHFRFNEKKTSGIGLYLCSEIIKKLNGRLEFFSPAQGFGVKIYL